MYPDWPESAADLVPLPSCDGPKLKPFDFQGPQKIEFLEYLGEGFLYEDDWTPGDSIDTEDRKAMRTLYNYSEPFSCECRAFARLQEAGHEELAGGCFGYLLLDKQHERAMMDQFSQLTLEAFNGNIDYPGRWDMRSVFLGRDGRPPPIRGIVKEFGPTYEDLRTRVRAGFSEISFDCSSWEVFTSTWITDSLSAASYVTSVQP